VSQTKRLVRKRDHAAPILVLKIGSGLVSLNGARIRGTSLSGGRIGNTGQPLPSLSGTASTVLSERVMINQVRAVGGRSWKRRL